jgi:hypothetical protein
MLVRLLYVSAINDGVSAADIQRLVAESQRRNRQRDLTGALMVCDGHFAQVLEGRELLVEETMRKIALDDRHRDLVVRERSVVTQRLFPLWDLAFVDPDRCMATVQDLLQQRCTPAEFIAAMAAWIEERKDDPF